MLSAFFGLNIVRKALQANQMAQDVVSHNIANANNPDYHRQRADIAASSPIGFPALNRVVGPGQFGSGADVATVEQIRDQFLESRLNTESQGLKQWEVLEQVLSQVEAVFQATSEGDLNDLIDQFFVAFDQLSQDPTSLSMRQNVLSTGKSLADAINFIYERLVALQEDANTTLSQQVDEVNSSLEQIAHLNELIRKIEADGDSANDLRDERDGLIADLSKLMDVSTLETEYGDKTIYINEQMLVQNNVFHSLEVVQDSQNPKNYNIRFKESLQQITITGGSMYANLSARDQVVPFYLDQLNEISKGLGVEVNALHSRGFGLQDNNGNAYTGDNFFLFDTLQTSKTNVSKATYEAVVQGTTALADGTTLLTTLDQLGVTAGTFTVDGQSITLAAADVTAGTAITLKELLKRIKDMAGVETSFNSANRKVIVTKKDSSTLVMGAGGDTSNFLTEAVAGLATANVGGIGAHVTAVSDDAGARFQVNSALFNNLNRVAAATDANLLPGDGSNAAAIAQLQSAKTMGEDEKLDTFQSFFQALVTQVGLDEEDALRQVDSFDLNVQVLKDRQASISGVNIDEELANMVKFQQAYNAAARMFQTMNEMLDVLIGIGAR